MANRVEVTINSRQYVVLADEPREYIEGLAKYIDDKVKLVIKGGQNVLGERPIILAALNICDEYFKCEEAGRVLQNQLKGCTEKLNAANAALHEFEGRAEQISFDEKDAEEKISAALKRAESAEQSAKALEKELAELKLKLEISKSSTAANTAGLNGGANSAGNIAGGINSGANGKKNGSYGKKH